MIIPGPVVGGGAGGGVLDWVRLTMSADQTTVVLNGRVEFDQVASKSELATVSSSPKGRFTIPDGTWFPFFTTRGQFSVANPAANTIRLWNVTADALLPGANAHVVQRIDSSSSESITPSIGGVVVVSGGPTLEARVTSDTNFTQMGRDETILVLLRLS